MFSGTAAITVSIIVLFDLATQQFVILGRYCEPHKQLFI